MFINGFNTLFLNTVLFIGIFNSVTPIYSVPIELVPSQSINYPINIACECDYNLYVDGNYAKQVGIVDDYYYDDDYYYYDDDDDEDDDDDDDDDGWWWWW